MHDFSLHLRPRGPQDPDPDFGLLSGDGRSPSWPAEFVVGPFCAELDLTGAQWTGSPQGVLIALRGHLSSHRLSELPELYARRGTAFVKELAGSFALILLDLPAGRVRAATDRLGSQRLYALQDAGHLWLSTTLARPEFAARPLSLAGLACYLTNGVMLNGLTLFEGVRALERAQLYRARPGSLLGEEYWPLRLHEQPVSEAGSDPRALQAELTDLLRAATARTLSACGDHIALSLSGGYDSRGLLSLLAASGRPFRSFSYTLKNPSAGSDASAAERLAAQYGVPHQHFTAYRGDLPSTLRRNADWGQASAHFCDEADAWAELDASAPSDVFAGEQVFEWSPHPAPSNAEMLRRIGITDFGPLAWLEGQLPPATVAGLRDGWNGELARALDQTAPWTNPEHKEIVLALNQYLPHILLSWRGHYAGHRARVHTPYLDGPILDFVQRVPLPLIRGKRIFKDTLRAMDPALFRVQVARSSDYEPDWHGEVLRQRGPLWESVTGRASRLDDLIEPEVLRSLLWGLKPPATSSRAQGLARQTLGRLRHGPLGNAVLGPAAHRLPVVDPATLLLRLLTLREFDLSGQPQQPTAPSLSPTRGLSALS